MVGELRRQNDELRQQVELLKKDASRQQPADQTPCPTYRNCLHGHGQVRLRERPVIGQPHNDDFMYYKDTIVEYKNIYAVVGECGLKAESYILKNVGAIVAKMNYKNTMGGGMAAEDEAAATV